MLLFSRIDGNYMGVTVQAYLTEWLCLDPASFNTREALALIFTYCRQIRQTS
jgi:hypothetical protein